MKFSEQWLREWVNPPITTAELTAQLTMAGLEVDAIEPVAGEFTSVVVGEVLAVEPHPDADKLRVCRVNVGPAAPLLIVCGASNVAVGAKVPVALLGAQLPGGLQIKKSQLRGVESQGMLCSAKELGMAEQSEGLLLLSPDARVGVDVRSVLGLDDVSITLGLTPNRGDCLSVQGVAREVAAQNHLALTVAPSSAVTATLTSVQRVQLLAPKACPLYCGRIIQGVDPTRVTPLWMQERLRRSGVRSLGPIVDVTNFVMLELGQPLHAFDLHKLSGAIHIRYATANEPLLLLHGERVALGADTLVIADERQALAMAGIMGGSDSAVSAATRAIFLESAFFAPSAIAGKARRYGLHTDSSHRFERGVSPELVRPAMERATQLLLMLAGGEAGPIVEVSEPLYLPPQPTIRLRASRIQRVVGVAMQDPQVSAMLSRLGMSVSRQAGEWQVIPPAYRFDIALEEDLIEELVRVYGYNRLPKSDLKSSLQSAPLPEARTGPRQIRQRLVSLGYHEVITYSFVAPKLQSLLDPGQAPVALANPIAADMSVMRTNLWPGLVQTLLYNLNRQQDRLMLFELGLRYLPQPPDFNQVMMLSGLLSGPAAPTQWAIPPRELDYFDAKGHLENLMQLSGNMSPYRFEAAQHPALHPGKCARILRNNQPVGWLGGLHPQSVKTLDLRQEVVLFEIEFEALAAGYLPSYHEISRFPAIRRDIALIVDRQISAQRLRDCIQQAAPEYLEKVELFDVYTGEGIDSGRKSVALGLTLQDLSRTLTDSEVEDVMQRIVGRLQAELGASLR
ncbi:MAG: phenylalanine--tRNA ligase subunit beta [Gammaproteobacteria bacterium]|nr:phenylalanine--tRNA ligase subunit beta [Gammaproteobacteria bacterium]